MATDISVRVCLRCRPLIPKELNDGCQVCLNFTSNNSQVILGKDKAFTYDSAYSPETPQIEVYRKSVSPMIQSLFKGYNVTVLAYGQTGSGKTHTMGTSHSLISNEKEMGVIPRAMQDLFKGIREREDKYAFIIKASFLEIYKEELHDLLRSTVERNKDAVAIRENFNGNLKGLIEEVVSSPDDVLAILCKGSLARSTGSTAMNSQSSRSHAIFTINIEQTEKSDTSININKGLLALGNVINALCDKNNHIPYRDSKLTRLLQDSLGGNSHTLMIACVSPADYNFEETLNTLRYADRARKIKNKPVINRDPQTIEIMRLKQLSYKQLFDQTTNLCEKVILAEMSRDKLKESLKELKSKTSILKNKKLYDLFLYSSTVEAMKNSAIDPDNVEAQNKLRMLEDIQNSIIQLQEEQKIDHSKVLDDSVGSPEKNAPDMDLSPEEEANRTEHTLRQAEMQRQLQILNEALNKKEELAEKMSENSCQFETMKDHYEEALKNMENEICSLQKERDDLSTNLKTTQSNPAAVKYMTPPYFYNTFTLSPCPIKSHPTSGDTHDRLSPPGTVVRCVSYNHVQPELDSGTVLNVLDHARVTLELSLECVKICLTCTLRTLCTCKTNLHNVRNVHNNNNNTKNVHNVLVALMDVPGVFTPERCTHTAKIDKRDFRVRRRIKGERRKSTYRTISEQRRKRLQELENKISDLKKKVVDQERMLKLKEQSENKVKVLANDIQTMKQQRVKLMKQMKVGTKQFNQWKTEKEREVTQLKQKDRKRQVELVKMEKTHSKQQNVLKRKIEQAVFHNKRLKDAMERHRLVSQERERKQNVNSDGIKDRIEQWLKQELELAVAKKESNHHLNNLIEDRKYLSQELNFLKI
ncbi:Chromosome-associated kinesin KIF4A [Nymphon striatum]|nr:Chromosome-associated kinesin KIF4A [Nymphon striatum]